MRFIANATILILGVTLSACVSTRNVPLSPVRAALLKGHSFATTRYSVPDFPATTPVKAELGMIGAFAMIAEGNSRIRENRVNDPANVIAAELAKAVTAKYSGWIVNSANETVSDGSVIAISKAYSNADYLIDVKTVGWGCIYYPFNWGRYRVTYSAQFRLIDTRQQVVLCEGFFAWTPNDTANAPGYGELMDNNAARLKAELKIAEEGAVRHFKTETLRL